MSYEFLPTDPSGRSPMGIGEAKQLPAIDAAGTRKRRARTKSSRSTKPKLCHRHHADADSRGSFRETGTVPSELTRAARVSSTPFARARSKYYPHKRSRQQSEKRHVNRLRRYSHLARLKKALDNAAPCCVTLKAVQGPAPLMPKFAHTHHSQTSHGAATLKMDQ